MPLERKSCVGSHPCQGYRKTSCNGWAWGLLSTGSLKFRELEPDGANGEGECRRSHIAFPCVPPWWGRYGCLILANPTQIAKKEAIVCMDGSRRSLAAV